ncbi:Ankyrin Repeat And Kh Domain-Containing Protein 1 [Manis pentadactyla]|nr:Ankyrin Repeat And Kh Domain-Containing Protein 1 [Manis pentadactyla]
MRSPGCPLLTARAPTCFLPGFSSQTNLFLVRISWILKGWGCPPLLLVDLGSSLGKSVFSLPGLSTRKRFTLEIKDGGNTKTRKE